jgi:hypothetical protein
MLAQKVLSREVISSGGSDMTGGEYRISGTVGQPVIGVSSSSSMIAGQGFWYQIESVPMDLDQIPSIPSSPILHPNYPNPFNPSTMIEFVLPFRGHVKFVIQNLSGKLLDVLIDNTLESGRHFVRFEARDLPAGVYIYRLTCGSFQAERRMLLLK